LGLVWLCASLALVAIVDVPLQIFQFKRALRMNAPGIARRVQGDGRAPRNQAAHSQMQQALARRAWMHKVPTADVLIGQPDPPLAVALKYDPKKMRAPVVLAKASIWWRKTFGASREEHRVPVFELAEAGARACIAPTDLNRGHFRAPVCGGGSNPLVHLQSTHLEPHRRGARRCGPPHFRDEYLDA